MGAMKTPQIRRLLVLAVTLLPLPAQAWDFSIKGREFTLDATNTLQYTYRFDNKNSTEVDDEYHHWFNTLDLSLSSGDFRLGGRFDLHLFADTFFDRKCANPQADSCVPEARRQLETRFQDQFVPQRIYFIVARPEFDLTLGDFYVSFGKGLALNVVKVGELSQDNAIRGGKFVLHQGPVELTFVGGQFNFLDVDEPTGQVAQWEPDPVVGTRLEFRLPSNVMVGAHGVFIPFSPNKNAVDNKPGNYHLLFGFGAGINDLFGDRLSLSAEVDFLQTVDSGEYLRGSADQWKNFEGGVAAYANGTLQIIEDLTLLAEFKYYDDFDMAARSAGDEPFPLRYHLPPTLEWIRADVKNNKSVWGVRARLDYNIGELGPLEMLAFVNYGYFKNWNNEGEGNQEIHNPMAGVEANWGDGTGQAQLSGGLRRAFDLEHEKIAQQDTRVEFAVEQALASNHSLALTSLFLLRKIEGDGTPLGPDEAWNEIELTLSYKWSPYASLDMTYEFYDKDANKPDKPDNQVHFIGGGAKYFITPATYISVRYGSNRPGIKCISGTCRKYSAFAGLQVLLVGRFSDLNKYLNKL